MAENSKIEWTDHTFNPWIGCTKVSPGCANCYAETQDKFRSWTPDGWGKGKPRRRTSPAMWRQPIKWDREAAEAAHWINQRNLLRLDEGREIHHRPRVFCASLADWLDHEVPIEWLADLLALIHATPNIDWLLLTKRPQNWLPRVTDACVNMIARKLDYGWVESWLAADDSPMAGAAPANVWMGTSVEDQQRADERIPELLSIPARVRFLSCEPLLGPVRLDQYRCGETRHEGGHFILFGDALTGFRATSGWSGKDAGPRIHWVIAGGESGPNARPMHPEWVRSLRDQCAAAGVSFLLKQWGEWVLAAEEHGITGSVMPANGVMPCGIPAEWVGMDGKMAVGSGHGLIDPMAMARVGKKRAGRTLDGREHNEFPTTTTPCTT